MPKLPIVSAKEVLKVLEHLDFVVYKQKGSHITLRKDKLRVTVPYHKELKTGTLKSILRQAGLDQQKFIELLEEV